MSRIAVIGAGAWGTALTVSLARRGGHELTLWAHSPAHAAELTETGKNTRYLPGFTVPLDVRITASLPDAIEFADIVLCVTPSQALRSVMQQIGPLLTTKQVLLSASKGIEEKTFYRMSQVICEYAPENPVGIAAATSCAKDGPPSVPTGFSGAYSQMTCDMR
jgi:glycerol-3-phosphate dehydrogenase (NAD(P)+)